MIPATARRVELSTSGAINARIHQEAEERIAAYRDHDRHALLLRRLRELDREWDIERALQTNFAALTLITLALGSTVNKRWLIAAAAIPAFMIQHALSGWCPPLPVLRRLGLRTAKEIADERFAIEAMLGRVGDGGSRQNLAHRMD